MYNYFNENPLGKSVGDCTVRAISLATEQSWSKTYWDLCQKGFELCDMPSSNAVWGAYLHEVGFKRYVVPDTCPDCTTVESFAYEHPIGTYILSLSGHVVCIKNGVILDAWNSSNETVLFYWRKA